MNEQTDFTGGTLVGARRDITKHDLMGIGGEEGKEVVIPQFTIGEAIEEIECFNGLWYEVDFLGAHNNWWVPESTIEWL